MLRLSKKLLKRSVITSTAITPFFISNNLTKKNTIIRQISLQEIADDQQLLRMSDFDEKNTSENRYNLKSREEHKEEIIKKKQYDVLIVGGGATGAGCVLSAANSGLSALLIDSYDYASGASSKSSKLIHGGKKKLLRSI